jgi:hypothetical protein
MTRVVGPGGRSLVLALLTIACGSDSSTAPKGAEPCTGSVALHVTAGQTPDISWTPACKLFLVGVEQVSDGHDLWFISADSISGGAGIVPPVRYGSTPAGTHQFENFTPLTIGVAVRALAFRPGGPAGTDTANVVLAGVTEFTP